MDIYKERIKPLFDGTNLSDKDLELAISLPRGIIYTWNTGKSTSYKNYVDKFAVYFNISADYLLGNANVKETYDKGRLYDPLDQELLLLIQNLSCEQKQFLIAQIKTLLQQ